MKKYMPVIALAAIGGLFIFCPGAMVSGTKIAGKYALEMLMIFPGVLILMGLADVWIPAQTIQQYLGSQAGVKGILLAIVLGTLPTGPVYLAFPLAAELLRKKASISNVMIFLGVWASLKIPQIAVEIQFMGIRFAAQRFVLTLIAIIAMGFIIGYLADPARKKRAQVDN